MNNIKFNRKQLPHLKKSIEAYKEKINKLKILMDLNIPIYEKNGNIKIECNDKILFNYLSEGCPLCYFNNGFCNKCIIQKIMNEYKGCQCTPWVNIETFFEQTNNKAFVVTIELIKLFTKELKFLQKIYAKYWYY
jgi:hypothetical protein